FAILAGQVVEDRPLDGPLGDVQHGGHRLHTTSVLKTLAHDTRHASFESAFYLANDFGIGLCHGSHATHHGDLTLRREPGEDLCAKRRGEVRHDQGNGLRVLVD